MYSNGRTPTASPREKSEKYQGRVDRTCQLVSREIPETMRRIPGGRLERGGGCLRSKPITLELHKYGKKQPTRNLPLCHRKDLWGVSALP